MTKKLLICFVLVGVGIFFLFYLLPFFKQERRARQLFTLCQSLKIGMTNIDVVNLMGEPLYQKTKGDIKYYYFLSPRIASEQTRVRIKDEKITGVFCGEGYEMYEPTIQNTTSTK